MKGLSFAVTVAVATVAGIFIGQQLAVVPPSGDAEQPAVAETRGQCFDAELGYEVNCVPVTFDTFDIPFADLPGARMDANGNLDPTSSPAD